MPTKKCTNCKKDIQENAKFCGYCGNDFGDTYIAYEEEAEVGQKETPAPQRTPSPTKRKEDSLRVHPWVRYWARMLDHWVFLFFFSIILVLVIPESSKMNDYVFGFIALLFWVFVEPIFLSTLGFTPGKWLCRITVRNSKEKKLTYADALNRTFNLWTRGLGFGIPFVTMITMLNAFGVLTSKGITSWDKNGGFVISHQKINPFRIFLIILIIIFIAIFYGLAVSTE
ncbi:RDD family protein [Candidatus Omnitrophota bacterium]